jgi:hypothetical protein
MARAYLSQTITAEIVTDAISTVIACNALQEVAALLDDLNLLLPQRAGCNRLGREEA